jgi:hypothetical protein
MPLPVAACMADSQILKMTIAPLAQGLDVFKGRVLRLHGLRAHPARHNTMKLSCNDFINFVASVSESTHKR